MTASHTLTAELIAFLHQQINVDEQAALGAKGDTPGLWEEKTDPATDIVLYDQSGKLTLGQVRHIALHDPARVLADVEVKRRIVDRYVQLQGYAERPYDAETSDDETRIRRAGYLHALEVVLRDMAASYATRPGYKEAWR